MQNLMQVMRIPVRLRRNRDAKKSPEEAYAKASIQLRVLVAVAAADGEIRASEYDRLSIIADNLSGEGIKDRVIDLLRMLLDCPPTEEDALRALISAPGAKGISRELLRDIELVARADGHVDIFEERLARLLSAVGGGKPISLRHTVGVPLDTADQRLIDRLKKEVEKDHEQAA